jgi:hypothetical protein
MFTSRGAGERGTKEARSSSPSAKSGSFQGGGGTARVCRLARSAEGAGSGAARAAQGLLLSIYATDCSQKVDAGGEDRGDGSLYQGRSSGNVSATVRKPPTIAMASTKKTTTTSSPRVIGFPTGPMHFVRCATACLFTTEHRNECSQKEPLRSGAKSVGVNDTASPSSFAVLRFNTSSSFVGCSTGRSAGLAPLRSLPRYVAARRNRSGKLAP